MSGAGLPLAAPDGCTLSPAGLGEQAARIAVLRPSVRQVERGSGSLRIAFGPEVDAVVVTELVETERGCCSFLDLEYDEDRRVLAIASDDPRGAALLATFATRLEGRS